MSASILQTKLKPVLGYTTIDAIVKQALIDSYDDSGSNYARYEQWGIRGWKEELTIDVIRKTKKVFLPIAANTKTVKLPPDFIDHVTIGIVDTNNKIQQLSQNNLITPPMIDDTAMRTECSCECGCQGELCADLLKIATVEEVTELGTKVIKTRTCKNGDVMQEITEPTIIVTATNKCDYTIAMANGICNECLFTLTVPSDARFPYHDVAYYLNGEIVNVGTVANIGALNAAFVDAGFTLLYAGQYEIASCDVYTDFSYVNNEDVPHAASFVQSGCEVVPIELTFPLTVVSYVKNNEEVEVGDVMSSESELDDFFASLGFTADGDMHYSISESLDSFASITVSIDETEIPNVFTASNCEVVYTEETQNVTREISICNLTVSDCGCPIDTPENVSTCATCFGCYPGCWNNWGCGFDESMFPTPSNNYGEYTIVKELGLIQINPTNFPYRRLYLEYYSDGFGITGTYYIPIVAAPAIRAYIQWQKIEHKRGIPLWEKERALQNFTGERSRVKKRISRKTLQEVYDIIRTLPVI
jgi:hypothetical protein